jgi:hypothetical protein
MPDDLDTLALKAGIAQAEGDLPWASALLVLSLLRVGVVERENSRLRESSAVSIARFGTLELSSRDKSLADCQFPGNLGQGRD